MGVDARHDCGEMAADGDGYLEDGAWGGERQAGRALRDHAEQGAVRWERGYVDGWYLRMVGSVHASEKSGGRGCVAGGRWGMG